MSAEEYENLMEDLELAADPKFRARIKQAEEEFARGEFYTIDQIDEILKQRQAGELVLADKGKRVYSTKRKNKK